MKIILIFVMFSISVSSFTQEKALLHLWPGQVPGESKEKKEPAVDTIQKDGVLRYTEVTDPAIEIRLADPDKNTGAAVIVCPGGGYVRLAYNKEGTEIADWLNRNGINAFILSYRIPNERTGALQDAQRAIRIVRSNAAKWKIDASKIGIMGFSAGADLSARAAILSENKTYEPVDKSDNTSCRPDFALLMYPAYFDRGENRSLTPDLKITDLTPPVFIFQSADDSHGNSAVVMAGALRDAKIPVELHLVAKGGHGYGLRPGNPAAETWPSLAEKWLKTILK
ncbi:MAG TPA: alpha/beta hydrolase [Bacteroidales bacterium]|nr:alpha/beta hydrolase [Bacteroidales bacterium]HRW84655.1 alpha/beta hydrolase [Bacteroidales bacterium]